MQNLIYLIGKFTFVIFNLRLKLNKKNKIVKPLELSITDAQPLKTQGGFRGFR